MQRIIYSVKELSDKIKHSIESQFEDIWIIGEISNFKEHRPSGHCYFSLKDESSVIKAILFKFQKTKIKLSLKDGIRVKAHGHISIYQKRGEYQIIIDYLEPEGIGDLQLAFLELKERLLKEGLFNQEFKQELPGYPKRIGVITSPTGAAIKDILNISKRRFPSTDILIYPAIVQGEGAKIDIANKIRLANEINAVDVLIVGRGGGSIEDLWAFNTEEVARAIFASQIPIISAVGHEIDYSIADFVADVRAPTPSAAAEIALPNRDNLSKNIHMLESNINNYMINLVEYYKERMQKYSKENFIKHLDKKLTENKIQLDYISQNLNQAFNKQLTRLTNAFTLLYTKTQALNPKAILQRGYSIVYLANDSKEAIKNSEKLKENDSIEIKFHKGKAKAIIKEK